MTIFATTARAVGAAGVLCALVGAPAWANTLDDLETILNSYNLVTSGDVSGSVHVEGRAYVGGNVTGGKLGFYNNPDGTSSPWAELIVKGNVEGGYHQILNGGDAWIGGNVENLDGGTGTAYVNGQVTGNSHMNAVENAGITIPDLYDGFGGFAGLSRQLANQASTDTMYRIQEGKVPVFSADNPVDGVSIFDISASELSSGDRLEVNPNSADLVVINVSGTNVNFGLNNTTDMSFADNILWNFYEAETLDVGRAWVGSVLAPNAHVNLTQNLDGSLVAASLDLRAELHPKGFSGDFDFLDPDGGVNAPAVPAPAAAPLLVFGLGAFAGLRRLRRKA